MRAALVGRLVKPSVRHRGGLLGRRGRRPVQHVPVLVVLGVARGGVEPATFRFSGGGDVRTESFDFDTDAGTITITGKVIRETGKGLIRMDETKTASGHRTLPLPRFAIETLTERRALPYLGEQDLIFPSTAGTLRDPNNFGRLWRTVRDELGVPEVTTHSFRKTVATLIDDQGLSARIGADHLGHAKVSMTQDRYMARGKVHTQVADVLDDAINDA